MSTSWQHGRPPGYRDKAQPAEHRVREDSAKRIVVIFGIIIGAIVLMIIIWRLALLQT